MSSKKNSSFFLFFLRVDITHVSSSYTMFMTNSMLLWWTLDSVPLPLVIEAKVAKEDLQ